jgi:hypothetical protein
MDGTLRPSPLFRVRRIQRTRTRWPIEKVGQENIAPSFASNRQNGNDQEIILTPATLAEAGDRRATRRHLELTRMAGREAIVRQRSQRDGSTVRRHIAATFAGPCTD